MPQQGLFYERAVPLSSERHRHLAVRRSADYSFARSSSIIPLLVPEFAAASGDHALVFVGDGEDRTPALVLGVREGENLYVTSDGRWDASYVPAFVRRYPFVFGRAPSDERFVLCVDEASSMLNTEGEGERVFETDGAQTPYLKEVLAFLESFQTGFRRTRRFVRRLEELDLLQSAQAEMRGPSGTVMLRGFMRVDREKLQGLDATTIKGLFDDGSLEAIFLHLASLRNLPRLAARASAAGVPDPQGRSLGSLNEGDILLN